MLVVCSTDCGRWQPNEGLTDESGGRDQPWTLCTDLGRGGYVGVRPPPVLQSSCAAGPDRVGEDSAVILSIHCPKTSRSSLALGDRQLLCLNSQQGQEWGRVLGWV